MAILAAVLAPSGAAGQAAQTRPAGYRIAGTVVNAETGEPVARALVAALTEAEGAAMAATESDANGHFSLRGLGAAKYQLTASRRGYRTAFYDEHQEFNSAIVTGPDQDTEHLLFKLTPGAMLHGVVTGDGGDAVEGGRVLLFERKRDRARSGGPAERVLQVGQTTTDDAGGYEFTGLEPGEYYVAVEAEPWYAVHRARQRSGPGAEALEAVDVAYPLTYYDSTTEEASATKIVLTKGAREEADLLLHAAPTLRLRVSARPARDGQPPRVELRTMAFGAAVAAESMVAGEAEAAREHAVEFSGVAPGHYELSEGDPPRVVDFEASASVEVDGALGAMETPVSGTLESLSGAAPENVAVILSPLNGEGGRTALQAAAHKGKFRFSGVPQGEWELSAQDQSTPYAVLAVQAGGASHAGGEVTVGAKPLELRATIAAGSTRITGFARKDGKGKAGAMVVLAPRAAGALHTLARRDQSDSDGSFNLRDVPPGEYTVVAIEDGWEMDWGLPGALDRYLPKGVPVRVTAATGKLLRLETPVPVEPR